MLRERNEHVNLTSIVSPEGILTLHMLDSLSIVPAPAATRHASSTSAPAADSPACRWRWRVPQREFTLIDGTQKKIRFVEPKRIEALDIRNAQAAAARAESIWASRTSTRWSRAVGSLTDRST